MGVRKSLSVLGVAVGAPVAIWGAVNLLNNDNSEAVNQSMSTIAEGNEGLAEWAPGGARLVGGIALASLGLGGLVGSGRPRQEETQVQTLTLLQPSEY